jgi:hypothetical protein
VANQVVKHSSQCARECVELEKSVHALSRSDLGPEALFVAMILCVVRRLCWSYGVMVSTLDSESSDPGSNPGRTSFCVCLLSTTPLRAALSVLVLL